MSRRHIFNDVQLHHRSFSLDRNKSCAARRRWMQNAFSISPMIYEPIIASRAQGQELLFRISAAHTHRAPTHSAPTLKRANFSFYWEKHQQEDCVIFLPLGAQKALAPFCAARPKNCRPGTERGDELFMASTLLIIFVTLANKFRYWNYVCDKFCAFSLCVLLFTVTW